MVADIGTLQRLPLIVGDSRARELAYTGRTFSGKEAEKYGLVLDCFANEDVMKTHVASVAAAISKKSPLTIRGDVAFLEPKIIIYCLLNNCYHSYLTIILSVI